MTSSDEIGEIHAFLAGRIGEDEEQAMALANTRSSDPEEQNRLRAKGTADHENAVGRLDYLAQLTAGTSPRLQLEPEPPPTQSDDPERRATNLAAMKAMAWRYRTHRDWQESWTIE